MLVVAARPAYFGQAFQPFFGAEAIVRRALSDELEGVAHIFVFPLTLDVWGVRPAYVGAFVVGKPRFFQR